MSLRMLFESPTHATFFPARCCRDGRAPCAAPSSSSIVSKSARICVGWKRLDSALMTGTADSLARPSTSWCPPTRAMMPSTIEPTTRAVSSRLSLTPSWMSEGARNMPWPPRAATLDSLATRVRVLRLLKMIAIVLRSNERSRSHTPIAVCFAVRLNCAARCKTPSISFTERWARVRRFGTPDLFVDRARTCDSRGLCGNVRQARTKSIVYD